MEMSFNDRGLIVRLRLILLLLTVTALRLVSSEEEMPVSIINRRLTGDTFQYFIINSSMPTSCIESGRNNLTFLVGDKRCVNNQDLFNGNPHNKN